MERVKPSIFIVRFEIINGTNSDYTTLKRSVEAAGFTKIVKNDADIPYILPHGMYLASTTDDIATVLNVAKNATAVIPRKKIRVFVNKSGGSAWVNLDRA